MMLRSRSSKDLSIFSIIYDKDKEALSVLLEGETNLQVKDASGRTPLTLAALLDQDDVITMLLNKGADINAANSSGIFFGKVIVYMEFNTLLNACVP